MQVCLQKSTIYPQNSSVNPQKKSPTHMRKRTTQEVVMDCVDAGVSAKVPYIHAKRLYEYAKKPTRMRKRKRPHAYAQMDPYISAKQLYMSCRQKKSPRTCANGKYSDACWIVMMQVCPQKSPIYLQNKPIYLPQKRALLGYVYALDCNNASVSAKEPYTYAQTHNIACVCMGVCLSGCVYDS